MDAASTFGRACALNSFLTRTIGPAAAAAGPIVFSALLVVPIAAEFCYTRDSMKVILANPRGFCAGVNMAIECLDQAIRICGPEIYVYHEIVHNKYVVERFTR